MRKALTVGLVVASVGIGGLIGAVAFAPGSGTAQTDHAEAAEGSSEVWCFGDGEGPIAAAADAIGIPPGDLLYAMRDGSTIADVAESEGVDPQEVVDAIVAWMQERLDAAVESGFFSREVADQISTGFADRAEGIVNGRLPFPGILGRNGFGHGPAFGLGRAPGLGSGPWGHGPWGHGPWGEALHEAVTG